MFNIKDGFKLGVGLSLGYAVVDIMNKVLGELFAERVNKWTNELKEKHGL